LYTFEISVGILPYPITFLVTDLISELYGKKKADQVVISGLIAAIFVIGLILFADSLPHTEWSPVDSATFNKVFGLFGPAVFASMVAYLTAQFIDIRMFHFWKRLTKGKHLWLRNNASTIVSQFVDTASVLLLLCFANVLAWDRFLPLLENGFLFKVLIALIDTPIIYGVIHALKGKIEIAPYQEGIAYEGS
ncbi:MAG: queuosine precursor transporter, partial [Candidatus Marinimicrobia bacterium]|nr:queuosine precursor transporter [Candidatus Neomarinimicrobiota bacterium]MDP6611576.1 queuosine precursor transporter [Candidatus Neomarinimicrobiota bacterium]